MVTIRRADHGSVSARAGLLKSGVSGANPSIGLEWVPVISLTRRIDLVMAVLTGSSAARSEPFAFPFPLDRDGL
jgi:hypothetical protein